MASLLGRESSFCDKEHNDLIVRALYEQKSTSTFCDVIMKVCGREICAHSNILAAASPYFKNFLCGDLPRQFSHRSPQVIEIQIDGSEPNMFYEEAVASVIDYIYTGKMTVNPNSVAQIGEIAKIMQLDLVVKFCDDFVNARTPFGELTVAAPSIKTTANVGVNTEHVVNPSHPHPLPNNIQWAASWSSITKLKAGVLASVACQVTPKLLGIEKANTKDVKIKDTKTQTYEREFPVRIERKALTSGKKRGRPPKYKHPDPPSEMHCPAVESEAQVSKMLIDLDGNDSDKVSMEPLSASKADTTGDSEGGEKAGSAMDTACEGNIMDAASPQVEGGDGDVQQEDDFVDDEDDADFTCVLQEGFSSVRRSGRIPKPSSKMKVVNEALGISIKVEPPSGTSDEHVHYLHSGLKKDEKRENSSVDFMSDTSTTNDMSIDSIVKSEHEYVSQKLPFRFRKKPRTHRFGKRAAMKCQCESCSFSTNKVRDMVSHKKLHKLEQNTCYYCDRVFPNRDELNEHMEKHKGPAPYFCPVCDYRSRNRTQLNLHLPKHSDEKPFVCDICSAGFKWKHALKNHMVVHSHKKDHLCDVCGYATAHKSQLKAHRLIHTGQTFHCNYPGCTFQATKKQNLKYHILTHTREKAHQCEICGQSFSLVKNLRRHMLLHTTNKPHRCDKCEFATTRFDKLKEHQLKQHGFGSPPEKRVRVADLVMQNLIEVKQELNQQKLVEETAPEPILTIEGASLLTADGEEITIDGSMVTTAQIDGKSVEILPGHTIIIAQPIEETTLEGATQIAVPVSSTQIVAEVRGEGDNLTYTVIPSNQVEYVPSVQTVPAGTDQPMEQTITWTTPS